MIYCEIITQGLRSFITVKVYGILLRILTNLFLILGICDRKSGSEYQEYRNDFQLFHDLSIKMFTK